MKKNPWLTIDAEDYESHMSAENVLQLQTLKAITRDQYRAYKPKTLMILGICTGNGLEAVEAYTNQVYGIDINQSYLDICKNRFKNKIKSLDLLALDLNVEYCHHEKVDLIIANMILEYMDLKRFFKQVSLSLNKAGVVSVVVQRNKERSSFVSATGQSALETLNDFHHTVDIFMFKESLAKAGFVILKEIIIPLAGGKEFIRIDFLRK